MYNREHIIIIHNSDKKTVRLPVLGKIDYKKSELMLMRRATASV